MWTEKSYISNNFTRNLRRQIIIIFNLDSLLKLIFYILVIAKANLSLRTFCENFIDEAFLFIIRGEKKEIFYVIEPLKNFKGS